MERIKELGVSGLFKLWTNKAVICFGDGTYALSDFLDDTPANETGFIIISYMQGKIIANISHFQPGY